MSVVKHAKEYNWGRVTIMLVAAVALVGIIIVTAIALVDNRSKQDVSAQTFINSIDGFEAIELDANAKAVTAADKCFNANGKLVAYAITGYGEGFCGRVSVRCYFDPDGKTLIGIQVIDQIETKGQGAEVADSPFVQRFEYAKLPVWFYDGTVPLEQMGEKKGTRIDTLTGATISANAVVKAVNAAYTYFTESVL